MLIFEYLPIAAIYESSHPENILTRLCESIRIIVVKILNYLLIREVFVIIFTIIILMTIIITHPIIIFTILIFFSCYLASYIDFLV